jgi:hypothetical protein
MEAFDAELDGLGFTEPIEGRIEAELLRRLSADEVLAGYFTGGIHAVETEELEEESGRQARTMYLVLAAVTERQLVGGASDLTTDWMLGLVIDRRASGLGTGKLRRQALVRRIKTALYGDDHARMSDAQGALTEALVEWGSVNKPAALPGNALLLTLMPFRLQSIIDSDTQEFIE